MQYEEVCTAARILSSAFDRLTTAALEDASLMAELGLTDSEERMARIDPGYEGVCVTSRLDAFVTDDGFKFMEYNAESPAGLVVQKQVEEMLFDLPYMNDFLQRHKYSTPSPHRKLLQALLEAYKRWGGAETWPGIAIVDWAGVATASEFYILRDYFESEGYRSLVTTPENLEFNGDVLSAEGFRIDILYKRVIIHEFLASTDETHPLTRAYTAGKICMANSFRSKVPHKKAGFAILSDSRFRHLFDEEQLDCIRGHIPWTRRVRDVSTTFEENTFGLLELLRKEQGRMVLKPNDDYGGKGVMFGWELKANEWDDAINLALRDDYVAQERVPAKKVPMPMFVGDRFETAKMNIDFDPFLFFDEVEGGLVRLSTSQLVNVSSGGGETGLIVMED